MVTKKVVSNKLQKLVKSNTPAKVTKKALPKSSAKGKRLVIAVGSHCFWTKDGQVLKDLRDLEAAFKKMSPEVFAHHVTKDKNDFATWVNTILKDPACATDLRKAKKAATAKTAVSKHLKTYVK